MSTSSMERTLSAKSLCQWTAATTLVAVGAVSFFSAHVLEKLSENGEISVDTKAFRKLGSLSIALDRTEEERLIREEDRLIEKAAFAQAEALPKTAVKFTKIAVPTRAKKTARRLAQVKRPLVPPMSTEEKETIALLEKAVDPEVEAAKLANLYRRVRFQFIAATDQVDRKQLLAKDSGYDSDREIYGDESVEAAKLAEAFEYDEIPVFDASDFVLPADRRSDSMIAFETAPDAPSEATTETAKTEVSTDQISSVASSTAKPEVFSPDPIPPSQVESLRAISPIDHETKSDQVTQKDKQVLPVITSPGLDEVPMEVLDTQTKLSMSTQNGAIPQARGPPGPEKSPEIDLPPPPSLSSPKSSPTLAEKSEKSTPIPPPSPEDEAEYSSDLASIFGDGYEDPADDYSDGGEYPPSIPASPRGPAVALAAPASVVPTSVPPASRSSASILDEKKISEPAISIAGHSAKIGSTEPLKKDLGNGVSQDEGGITISWNDSFPASPPPPSSVRNSSPIYVGKPNTFAGIQKGKDKLSFSRSSSLIPSKEEVEEGLPTKKCDTEKLGVEAFNPAAEKETLAVCRRPLSLEGTRDQERASWWEAHSATGAHWPTLIYQRKRDAHQFENRVPMFATASIRILSTLMRTNTHTGTGIVFGEVPRGFGLRLIGRSDAPVFLDGDMKVEKVVASSGTRKFVFFNVEPGQPLLSITDGEGRNGSIPLLVKSGTATYLRVPEMKEIEAKFTVFDASSAKESRLSQVTVEVIGQPGRVGISDKRGMVRIPKVISFEEYPLYIDLVKDVKSYKNRYRVPPSELESRAFFFFDEKRVNSWISQLAGGVSPFSGMIVGIVPKSVSKSNHLRIGTFEKKGSLIPERYLLGPKENLVSDSQVTEKLFRFVGVQIPEGVAIPSVLNAKGELLWSEVVYAQPGVVNVVGP